MRFLARRFALLTLLQILLCNGICAITLNSNCDGDWFDPLTWDTYTVPGPGDQVFVTHYVRGADWLVLDSNFVHVLLGGEVCGDGYMTVPAGSAVLVEGTLKVNGFTIGGLVTIQGVLYAHTISVWGCCLAFSGGTAIIGPYTCTDVFIPCKAPEAALLISDTLICQGDCIQFTDDSGYYPSAWEWTFSGPVSGSSTDEHPLICYDSIGVYDVKLVVENSLGADSVEYSGAFEIIERYDIDLGSDTTVSWGDTVFFSATTGFNNYIWNVGASSTENFAFPSGDFAPNTTTTVIVTAYMTNGCIERDTVEVTTVVSIGTSDIDRAHSPVIYPNPSNGLFTIDLLSFDSDPLQLEITNLLGRVVLKYEIPNGNSMVDVNLLDHQDGVYLVNITNEGSRYAAKLLKQ